MTDILPNRDDVYKVTLGAVLAIAAGIAAYGAYYQFVGLPHMSPPSPDVPSQVVHVPHPYAWVLMAAAAAMVLGLSLRQLWIAWIAAMLIGVFAAMNVFNIGTLLIPVVGALWLLLGLMTWARGGKIA